MSTDATNSRHTNASTFKSVVLLFAGHPKTRRCNRPAIRLRLHKASPPFLEGPDSVSIWFFFYLYAHQIVDCCISMSG